MIYSRRVTFERCINEVKEKFSGLKKDAKAKEKRSNRTHH